VLIQNLEDLFQNISICDFDSKKKEYFYFLKDVVQEVALRHVYDEMTQEVVVYFSSDLLINTFVDVVVLIGRLALALLEMLVEFAAILEKQVEYLADFVVYHTYLLISLRDYLVLEGFWADEHTFEDVDNFNLQFRVRNFLVNREENVKYVSLVLNMVEIIELRGKNSQQNDKKRSSGAIAFDIVFFIILFSRSQSLRFDEFYPNLHILCKHFLKSSFR
jgi:hypothetical protein